jgi:hypothetical protein
MKQTLEISNKKTIYSRDVIFREFKSTHKHEDEPREVELEKI